MFHLFDAYGIELEYMIVDARSLDVRPISDSILRDENGDPVSDLDFGPISWSNELTHHVIELKTNGPAEDLGPLANQFQDNVNTINHQLKASGACLLPTAMHPWMNPRVEMQLWPHDYHTVYESFDKIFDCRGHGWANLQSMHINLPFADDEEFGRLHAAIRLILPLLPALAASSPFQDGQASGSMDSRLDVYRRNAKGVASITGRVIPEPVFDHASYEREILKPMYRDIAPHDPEGVLQEEFLNARGAIARFSRGAIEIRVIDLQECPAADLAIAALTVEVLKLLVNETWTSLREQQSLTIDELEPTFLSAINNAGEGTLAGSAFLRQFGMPGASVSLCELWRKLYDTVCTQNANFAPQHGAALEIILNQGCLAQRLLKSVGRMVNRQSLHETYSRLASCLARGELFRV